MANYDTVTESDMNSLRGPEDETWDDWVDDSEASYTCLFCPTTFAELVTLLKHASVDHDFDYAKIRQERDLDFYGNIKLVNYIRSKVQEDPKFKMSDADFVTIETSEDEYLKPVMEDDALLYELDEVELPETPIVNETVNTSSADASADSPTVAKLKIELEAAFQKLKMVENQFAGYKHMVTETFFDDGSERMKANLTTPDDVGNYYYNSYANNDIHETMLKDKVRTDSYRDFMYDNKDAFKGKVVLDVGCGTGILSMFAAKAGASKVIAVDNSEIIEKARMNVKENGLDHIITLVRGKVEEVTLPVQSVDIIISEWMGYFLLYEAMLDSVLVARDRYLAPNGILGPSHSQILLTAIDDEDFVNERFNFWSDVYGFKMSAMSNGTRNEAIVDFVDPETTVTSVAVLKTIDIHETSIAGLDFQTSVKLEATREGTIHAFVGYFDIQFVKSRPTAATESFESKDSTKEASREAKEGDTVDLIQGHARSVPNSVVSFTTGPGGMNTHWKQTFFVLDKAFSVKKGSIVHVDFLCKKSTGNVRELQFSIKYSCEEQNVEGNQNFWLR